MMIRSAAAFAVAYLVGTSAFAQPACDGMKGLVESGALVAEAATLRWGDGQLSLKDGTSRNFSFKGVELPDIKAGASVVVGIVYNLRSVEDFAGTYSETGTGVPIAAGPGEVVINNDKCVFVRLRSRYEGVRLSPPGPKSIQVKLAPLPQEAPLGRLLP